jgi:hypothetical protein
MIIITLILLHLHGSYSVTHSIKNMFKIAKTVYSPIPTMKNGLINFKRHYL